MSIATNACLEHIIGISDTDCSCYTAKPAEVQESLTELYLDQLIPLPVANGMESCTDGDMWDVLMQSRSEGIIKFQSDMSAAMMQNWEMALHQWTGKIGETRAKHDKVTTKTYAALMLYCKDIRGGTFTLKSIGALFAGTGIRNVTIYDNLMNNYGTIAIDTFANIHYDNKINPEMEFQMHSDEVANVIYYLVYTVDQAIPARDNMLACAGCTKLHDMFQFCIATPYFNKKHDRRYFWAEWMICGIGTIYQHRRITYTDLPLIYRLTAQQIQPSVRTM
jgi:hypothetical protein